MTNIELALNPIDWSGVSAIVSALMLILNILLLLSVIIGYKTIKEEVKNRDSSLLQWAMTEISKIKDDTKYLENAGKYCHGDFEDEDFDVLWTKEQIDAAYNVSISLQRLSYMAIEGLISKEHFAKMWGPTFVKQWDILEIYIRHKRHTNGEPLDLESGAFTRKDFEMYVNYCRKS